MLSNRANLSIDPQMITEALPLRFGLRQAAEQRQLSINEVARLSGVPITTVWRIWIRLATLAKLAAALGLDAHQLLYPSTDKTNRAGSNTSAA